MAEYQRTGRRLKRNHSNALPRYIIAYQTETQPHPEDKSGRRFSHSFRCASAIYCRLDGIQPIGIRRLSFADPTEFWDLLDNVSGPRHTTWIVGQNILDSIIVSGFAQRFEEAELTIEWPRTVRKREDNDESNVHASTLAIIENPPTILACKRAKTQGRLVFVDTGNWFSGTISDLAICCHLPRPIRPATDSTDRAWSDYTSQTTEITFKTFIELIQWVKQNDFGLFRYTGAAQAMSAYRHRFIKHDICIHDNKEVKALERSAYFGGRTEVFKLGEFHETVYQLDVNALFPSVMQAARFPRLLHRWEKRDSYLQLRPAVEWAATVAECEIIHGPPIFPVRQSDRVIYPVGKFRTTLCGSELERAISSGIVDGIRSWAEYRLDPIFTNWVDTLWQMRQEYKRQGNELYDEFCKRLMNSLYGKFAQKSSRWINVDGDQSAGAWESWLDKDSVTGEVSSYRTFGYQVQKQVEPVEIPSTFVAVAAFVTSAARMRMNDLRDIAGRYNVYYQGVDGLIVTREGLYNLSQAGEVEPAQLGKLRLQCEVSHGEIAGCADYRLDNKVVLSGRASSIETTETGEILQRRYSTLSRLFKPGNKNQLHEEVLPWQRSSTYHKGTVAYDGWVSPLELDELNDSILETTNHEDCD